MYQRTTTGILLLKGSHWNGHALKNVSNICFDHLASLNKQYHWNLNGLPLQCYLQMKQTQEPPCTACFMVTAENLIYRLVKKLDPRFAEW